MPQAAADPTRPIRIALPGGLDETRRVLAGWLRRHSDRVRVVTQADDADLVLVDPYVGGSTFDAAALASHVVGNRPIVIFTASSEVDHLAFTTAAAALRGRLRGWLSTELNARSLVGSLELIRDGTIVLHGSPDGTPADRSDDRPS
jgi:hypothetical protein